MQFLQKKMQIRPEEPAEGQRFINNVAPSAGTGVRAGAKLQEREKILQKKGADFFKGRA